MRNFEMVAEVNLCGSNNFGSGISGNENSSLAKVHDLVSSYFTVRKEAVSGNGWCRPQRRYRKETYGKA